MLLHVVSLYCMTLFDKKKGLRQKGWDKNMWKDARKLVMGVVQTVEGLPLMHPMRLGYLAGTKTLQRMLQTVLQRPVCADGWRHRYPLKGRCRSPYHGTCATGPL